MCACCVEDRRLCTCRCNAHASRRALAKAVRRIVAEANPHRPTGSTLPREISPEEVRVGDRLMLHHLDLIIEGTVYKVERQHASSYGIYLGNSTQAYWSDEDKTVITLLDRPLPPIPTDEGTVLRSKVDGSVLVYRNGEWRVEAQALPVRKFMTREHYDVLVPEQVDQ